MVLSTSRAVTVGWLVLAGLIALFVFLGLLKFLVFLLFVHLVVDLLVHGLGNRVPLVSQRVMLYAVYMLVAAAIVVLAVVVVPNFLSDLPAYVRNVEANFQSKVAETLAAWNIHLDIGDLHSRAADWGRSHLGQSFDVARRAGTNIVLLVVAFVITFLLTHDRLRGGSAERSDAPAEDLWRFLALFVRGKVTVFYGFFRLVMAGQVIISLINTTLTFALLVVLGIPHKVTLTSMVFVFGLLPVVGNLISNTLICLSAFLWAGPVQVIAALVFLVVIHKLEYFLNGKIIGDLVKLPMALTLVALIVGEALFHISGMILAIPVLLFARAELSGVRIGERANPPHPLPRTPRPH